MPYSFDIDGVVLYQRAWRAEKNDTPVLDDQATVSNLSSKSAASAYRGIVDSVISNKTVHAADTNAVSPLLEEVRTTRPNIVMLYSDVVARKRAFCDVQT